MAILPPTLILLFGLSLAISAQTPATATTTNNNSGSYLVEYSHPYLLLPLEDSFPLKSQHLKDEDYYFIRVIAMADQSMLDHYGDMESLVQYVLTLLRGVNELYRKGHLGKRLIISLGKVFLSKNIHRIMGERGNPRDNLKSLCKWQKYRTTVEGHHLSLFLTRRNLCNFDLSQNNVSTCNTLGLAKTWSYCSKHESCVLNQDIGFNTIHTIAHEIAHTFGVTHDDKEENNGSYYIMFPNVKTDVPSVLSDFIWSQQSRSQFQKFLMTRSESGCLHSASQYEEDLMSVLDNPYFLPGISWSGDEQCRFAFVDLLSNQERAQVRRCMLGSGICRELWCLVRGRCMRAPVMPLEGTICGYHRWCTRGSCQLMSQTDESEGQWEQWSSWSACSRDCRAGLSYSRRKCVPSESGQFCKEGYEDTRHKLCNHHSPNNCPDPNPDYECQKAIWPRRLRVKSSNRNQCLIYCDFQKLDTTPVNEEDLRQIIAVEEGTFCSIAEDKVCIDGDCVPIDCNGKINSNVVTDECDVCGGDGSSCAMLQEEKVISDAEARLIFITEFSKEAFDIRVNMVLPNAYDPGARVYLAAAAEQNGFKNILHMYNDIRSTGIYYIRDEGTGKKVLISYRDQDQQFIDSSLNISTGFKNKVIRLYILNPSQVHIPEARLDWSYRIPLTGNHERNRKSLPLTDDPRHKKCNHMNCGIWWVGKWQECEPATRLETRSLFCLNSERRPQPPDFCDSSVKPDVNRSCVPENQLTTHLETSYWAPGVWSFCTEECGYGVKERHYICTRPHDSCDPALKPSPDTRECFVKKCLYNWWFECWGPCENGYQRRRVYCLDEHTDGETDPRRCSKKTKPKDYKDC